MVSFDTDWDTAQTRGCDAHRLFALVYQVSGKIGSVQLSFLSVVLSFVVIRLTIPPAFGRFCSLEAQILDLIRNSGKDPSQIHERPLRVSLQKATARKLTLLRYQGN